MAGANPLGARHTNSNLCGSSDSLCGGRTPSWCWRSSSSSSAPLVILRTPTDIFPNINIPVVSTIWNYTGLSAPEMTNRIVTSYERAVTTTVNDIEHIESQTLAGHLGREDLLPAEGAHRRGRVAGDGDRADGPAADAARNDAAARHHATAPRACPCSSSRSRGRGSPSSSSSTLGNNGVRAELATVQGAAIPYPYGGKQRQIQVDLDLHALQSRGLSASDVVNAISAQNLILPAGNGEDRHVRVRGRDQQQPGDDRGAERPADPVAQRRGGLHPGRRARARRQRRRRRTSCASTGSARRC